MASCSKCLNTSFKYEEHTPNGSKFPQGFIVCSSCGVAVGLVSPHNLPTMMEKLNCSVGERLERIERLLLSLGQAKQ